MPRPILDEIRLHPAIRERVANYRSDILQEVQATIAAEPLVVIGMAQNPFPKKARRLLEDRKIAYKYLEYGSYMSEWRKRLVLKMWSGWPTLPMVFVKGTLVGGFDDLKALVDSGELAQLLK